MPRPDIFVLLPVARLVIAPLREPARLVVVAVRLVLLPLAFALPLPGIPLGIAVSFTEGLAWSMAARLSAIEPARIAYKLSRLRIRDASAERTFHSRKRISLMRIA